MRSHKAGWLAGAVIPALVLTTPGVMPARAAEPAAIVVAQADAPTPEELLLQRKKREQQGDGAGQGRNDGGERPAGKPRKSDDAGPAEQQRPRKNQGGEGQVEPQRPRKPAADQGAEQPRPKGQRNDGDGGAEPQRPRKNQGDQPGADQQRPRGGNDGDGAAPQRPRKPAPDEGASQQRPRDQRNDGDGGADPQRPRKNQGAEPGADRTDVPGRVDGNGPRATGDDGAAPQRPRKNQGAEPGADRSDVPGRVDGNGPRPVGDQNDGQGGGKQRPKDRPGAGDQGAAPGGGRNDGPAPRPGDDRPAPRPGGKPAIERPADDGSVPGGAPDGSALDGGPNRDRLRDELRGGNDRRPNVDPGPGDARPGPDRRPGDPRPGPDRRPGDDVGPGRDGRRSGDDLRNEDIGRIRDERRTRRVEGVDVITEPGGRTILRDDRRVIIRNDELDRLEGFGQVRRERRGDDYVTIVERPGGVRIVTITDIDGHVIRRVRRMPDGREYVLFVNRPDLRDRYDVDVIVNLPPPPIDIPRDEYVVEADAAPPQLIYDTFAAPPVAPLDRRYSLEQVVNSPNVLDRVRRVDLDTITFDTGSWKVAEGEIGALDAVAEAINDLLGKNPNEVFLIEGHTDAVGSDIDNLSLSDRRAEEVAYLLTEYYEVPPENLTTKGYGESQLKVATDGPARENRRVTMRRITPLLETSEAN